MRNRFMCVGLLAMGLLGCAATPLGRTRAMLEEGDIDGAASAAGSSWAALREVSLAIAASASEHDATRHEAVRALEGAGQAAEPVLLRLAGSEDPLTSALGAAALLRSERGDDGLLRALLQERLGSADPEVRAVSVSALGALGEDESFYRTYLSDQDPEVRMAAVDALATARGVEGASSLLTVAAREDLSSSVRAKALRGLGRSESRSEVIVPLAADALRQESLPLRLAAVDALSRVAERGRAVALLEEVFNDENGAVRVRAAVILAGWDDGVAREALRETILDGEADLAVTAAIGAGQLGDVTSDTLRAALDRDDSEVRLHVAAALLRSSEPDGAMEVLRGLIEEPGWVGLHAALIVMQQDRDSAVPRIGEALIDPDEALRAYAARSCVLIPGGAGLDLARRNLVDDSPMVRLAAAAAILRIMAREG